METQKIVNLLNDTDSESSKFATRKWYVINEQNKTEYGEGNENNSSIKFQTKVIKSSLFNYLDAYDRRYNSYRWKLHLKIVLHLEDV